MSNRDVKQRGFGTIRVVAFLVVAGAVASMAWLGYSINQKAHQVKQASNAAVTSPASISTANSPVSTQQAAANQSVVKIPELGIQITVPNNIKDLKYQVSTVRLTPNGNQATLAMFSTVALTALDSKCGASNMPLGSLERASGQYPSNDRLATFDYGRFVKQFSTFYISAGVPNAPCSTQASVRGNAVGFKDEFITAESTIQQLN